MLRRDTLLEIGAAFKIEWYSTVSSVVERMEALMKKEKDLNASQLSAFNHHLESRADLTPCFKGHILKINFPLYAISRNKVA
jgi:hypothetical protein